jgi:WD40 repeat protein
MHPPDAEPTRPPLTTPLPASTTDGDAGRTGPYTPQGESTDLAAGQAPAVVPSVAGYEILGVLGRGGMGVVYRARHLALKRTVALKMIRTDAVPDDQARARFRAEAEAAARLAHPNIVGIFEIGDAGGLPYCALEFQGEGSLSAKLAGTPLPPREAAALAETLARAVQHAHERGIIHRDLKPANILLASGGVPKVSDFGLARRLDEDSGQTQAGAVLGTPSYMAPEQAAGQTREVGPAADTYALGAILYECLTGRPPFKGATVRETLEQVRTREPVPVRQLQPGCPRDLETVCLKCLEKEPQRRYASAAALADDLRRFLDGRPVVARPVGAAGRLVRWGRRNPGVAALVSALGLLLTAVAVGASVAAAYFIRLSGDLNDQLEQTQKAQQKAEAAEGKERTANRRLTQELGNSLLDQSLLPWREGDVSQARALCEQVPPEARFWEWRYLARFYYGQALTCPGHRGGAWAVSFSPQGDAVVSGGGDGAVRLWDPVLGRQLRALTGHAGVVHAVHFSPDGLLLASAGEDGTARLWDARTGKLLHTLRGHTAPVCAVAWSPDGRRLATEAGDGSVRLWDSRTGAEGTRLVIPLTMRGDLAFSPDGRLLAAAADRQVILWDAGAGQVLRTLSLGIVLFDALAFSPVPLPAEPARQGEKDKRWLLAAGGSGRAICLWEADTGRLLRTLSGEPVPNSVTSLCFRPDGQQLASCCGAMRAAGSQKIMPDGAVRVWNVDSGRQLFSCGAHTGNVAAISYSPDGRRLASALNSTGEIRVWDVRTPPERQAAPGAPTPVHAVCFSPDGRRLASASGCVPLVGNPGQVTVWDAAAGVPGLVLRHPTPVRSVSFSPSGEFLASGDQAGLVRLWDVRPGGPPAERLVRTFPGHEGSVESVCFSPDGRLLASGGSDKTVRLWEVNSGRLLRTHRRPGNVASVCFDHAGRLAAGGGSTAGDIVLWAPDGTEIRQFTGHRGAVLAVCFNRDGTLLASAGMDGTVRVWEADSGRDLHALTGHTSAVTGVSFSPDGLRLASCDFGRGVRLWDTESGRAVLTLTGPGAQTRGLAFSPDGRRLAAAGGNDTPGVSPGEVYVWDAGPPRLGIRLTGHDTPVSAVWFEGGSRVLARAADGRVRAWSLPRGEPLGEVKETAPPGAGRVAESPDRAFRATGFQDHTVYLVDLHESDEEREERRLAARPDPE